MALTMVVATHKNHDHFPCESHAKPIFTQHRKPSPWGQFRPHHAGGQSLFYFEYRISNIEQGISNSRSFRKE
jgi:hypothetical protein